MKKYEALRTVSWDCVFSDVSAGSGGDHFSFNESRLPVRFTGFSLKWYQELLNDRAMIEALGNSLILGVSSCLVSAVIGTLGAVGLSRIHWKTKGALEYISILPLMIPEIILGMVFHGIFLSSGYAVWNADPSSGTHGFLCTLYFNAGKSKTGRNGSFSGGSGP